MTNFEDLYQVSKTFDKKWIRILSIRHEWIKIHEIPWGKTTNDEKTSSRQRSTKKTRGRLFLQVYFAD